MTYAEVFAEIDRDLPNLERFLTRQEKMMRRYALKHDRNDFPMSLIGKYTSPRRIKYVIIVFLMKRNADYCYYSVSTTRHTPAGKEVFMCKSHENVKMAKVVCLPHAIKRYGERMKFTETGDELIKKMLVRSFNNAFSRDQRLGARCVRYKGDMLYSLSTKDGAFLGKQNGDIFVTKTFITYDMMSGLQLEEFSKHREAFERGVDAADVLIQEFNNRKSLRTNQPILKRE